MNTSYSDIIELVLSISKSYEADLLFDDAESNGKSGTETLIQLFKPYFKFASGELQVAGSNINTSRNDFDNMFTSLLTDAEQLIFAKFVLIGYLEKETYDILQMNLHLQDGDFKTFAEKNNLEAKQNVLNLLKEEVGWNLTRLGYTSQTNLWG